MNSKPKYLPNGNLKNLKTVQWNRWESIPYDMQSKLPMIILSGMKIVDVETDERVSETLAPHCMLTERDGIYYLVTFNDKERRLEISVADEFEIEDEYDE